MKIEKVEIYSNTTNMPVMRHPNRHFPGVLLQGDTLYSICQRLDDICSKFKSDGQMEVFEEINVIRNSMWERLSHYKSTLVKHGIQIPFSEQ